MSRSFDLGTISFNDPESGQRLVSQTAITLSCLESSAALPVDLDCIVKAKSWWVNSGRTMGIDVFIQGSREDLGPRLDLREHIVDMLQTSLMRSGIDPVILDMFHDYNSDTPKVTTNQSSLLIQPNTKDQNQRLHCRIPRRVRKSVAIDPQPPPGIKTALLSNIRINLKVPPCRPERSRTLTRSWLDELPSELVEYVKADHIMGSKYGLSTQLCPTNPLLSMSCSTQTQLIGTANYLDTYCGERHVDKSDNLDHERTCEKRCSSLDLLGHAIQRVILASSPTFIGAIAEVGVDREPRLTEIAPFVFNSTHKNNVRQRAGFIPGVAKSLESILCKTNSEKLRKRSITVKHLADTYREATAFPEKGGFRSLLKCLLWTSLQSRVYKRQANEESGVYKSTPAGIGDDCSMLDDSSWTDTDLLCSHSELTDIDSDVQFWDLDGEYLDHDGSEARCQASLPELEDCSDDIDASNHFPDVFESEACKSDPIDSGSEDSNFCNEPSLTQFPFSPLAVDSDMLSPNSEFGNDSESDTDLISILNMDTDANAWFIGDKAHIEGEEMLD